MFCSYKRRVLIENEKKQGLNAHRFDVHRIVFMYEYYEICNSREG